MELKSYHQLEESRKGQRREETPAHIPYQPPRVLLTGGPLGLVTCTPPGRTLSQRDRLETAWKLMPTA